MGTKIRDLTTTTSVATNDFLVVAKSDNTTKKISGANLTSSLGGGGGQVVNAPVRDGNLSGSTSKYPMTSSQPGYVTVGYEVPSGVSKIVYLGAGGAGSASGLGSSYIGGTIPQNTGDHGPNDQINYLGNDQNFMVVWGMPPNNNVGAYDNKVYIFAVQPAGGFTVWSSITLLLI